MSKKGGIYLDRWVGLSINQRASQSNCHLELNLQVAILLNICVKFNFYVTGNCTVGKMIEGNICKACPMGTYQDEKWQTECKPCGENMTTFEEGATTVDNCFRKLLCLTTLYYVYFAKQLGRYLRVFITCLFIILYHHPFYSVINKHVHNKRIQYCVDYNIICT